MARPRKPDGRRVPVSFKLTEDERDLVDSLRGETERSVWLRERAMEAADRIADSGIQKFLGNGITVDPRQPPGTVSVVAPGEEVTQVRSFALALEEPEPAVKPCRHEGLKLTKGVCPDCFTYVDKRS